MYQCNRLKNPWDSPGVVPALNSDLLVIFDYFSVLGLQEWRVNPILLRTIQNGTGVAHVCFGRTYQSLGKRISLRFGPKDFKRKALTDWGEDWRIGYEDIKPYYDAIDRLIGVFGTNEELENEPDGYFLPPPNPTFTHELMIKKRQPVSVHTGDSLRLSGTTKPLENNKERGACICTGQCGGACSTVIMQIFLLHQRADQTCYTNRQPGCDHQCHGARC